MEIHAERVAVDGSHGPLLRPTSLRARSGDVLLVTGEPGDGHTALALVLAGRLKPSQGHVLLDGVRDVRAQQRRLAIVDAPGVTAAEDALPVRRVVEEGLALSGRRSGRRAVRDFLAAHELAEHADARWESLPANVRVPLSTALAAHQGVHGLVLDTPDRHGGSPHDWYSLARRYADRGLAVVVLCGPYAVRDLGLPSARIGELEQPIPNPEGSS